MVPVRPIRRVDFVCHVPSFIVKLGALSLVSPRFVKIRTHNVKVAIDMLNLISLIGQLQHTPDYSLYSRNGPSMYCTRE